MSDAHHDSHEPQGWISKYVFSVDHKVIGLQYLITSLLFLLFGFSLMLLMRLQLAFPTRSLPFIGSILTNGFPGGHMTPEFYNQLGAMHGTIMVFLGIVPLGVGAFGNYVLPLQIGAPDMAFPRLNMMSYWLYLPGGLLMLSSFLMPGGAAQSGWTSYPPLSIINPGQTVWLLAMVIIITSSLLGSINFLVTAFNMRAPGLTFWRLPIFSWSQIVTAVLLLLAFPPLEAASILQLMDRVAHTSFYMPAGLMVYGKAQSLYAGGGQPILWQHLFWFLAHPEVYVLVLPPMGIVAEIIANNTRKPLHGYTTIVYSMLGLGFMSFIVWAHHMFLSGMSPVLGNFFLVTTMIISIPSVAVLTSFIFSLRGGSIRFTVPMLFALAFLPLFGIGGLTGLPLGLTVTDIYLHDTYYVIGHFHFVVVTGSIIALMGGIYHWFPKWFGRSMNEFWGKFHFWVTTVSMTGIFFPMLIMGLAGAQRRLYDPMAQVHNHVVQPMNVVATVFAYLLLLGQIPFIINFFYSIFKGEKASENPWDCTTLEWACPSPPPHGNFVKTPRVYRGPYEYSVPGHKKDWSAQHLAPEAV